MRDNLNISNVKQHKLFVVFKFDSRNGTCIQTFHRFEYGLILCTYLIKSIKRYKADTIFVQFVEDTFRMFLISSCIVSWRNIEPQ